jgi:hypothetical protein
MQAAQTIPARRIRSRVARAFRAMAHGIESKSAYASTVQFYRSSRQQWTKQLA